MLPAEKLEEYQSTMSDEPDFPDAEPGLSGVLLLGTLVIVVPYLMLIASFLLLLKWSLG